MPELSIATCYIMVTVILMCTPEYTRNYAESTGNPDRKKFFGVKNVDSWDI